MHSKQPKLYHEQVYRRFGLPKSIISDRGPQFASRVFQGLCSKLGITSKLSTAYHPQTDGQTERANQEIEAYLRIYCTNSPQTWADALPDLEFVHNSQIHSVTKATPFHIIQGYTPTAIPNLVTSTFFSYFPQFTSMYIANSISKEWPSPSPSPPPMEIQDSGPHSTEGYIPIIF